MTDNNNNPWNGYLSPLKLSLLIIDAICFGGCIVLLALTEMSGPLVLLTIGTGLMLVAGLTGTIMASRHIFSSKESRKVEWIKISK